MTNAFHLPYLEFSPFTKSTIRVEEFNPIDIELIAYRDEISTLTEELTYALGVKLKQSGQCFTVWDGDKILGCGGYLLHWQDRVQLWAIVSKEAKGKAMIYWIVKRFIEGLDCVRIECAASVVDEKAQRLIHLLGFECEGLMRKYLPDGRDCYLYARIKNG